MSWLFSQALVEEYLEANCLDGEQFVQSSGNPIQQAYCAPDKMTVFSRLSRFGMTYKPLTDIPGEDLSMSSVVAFHVKTLVQQEKAQELTESDQECGEKWHGSFVKFDPDSHSWRTHQCSLLGGLEPFSETWPQWGLMRDGECWEQRTLEQTIRGTEFGLSPNGVATFHTPNTTGLDGGSNSRKALRKRKEEAKFPTPTSSDWMNPKQNGIDQVNGRYVRTSLTTGVKFGAKLSDAVNLTMKEKFPTPTSSDHKDQPTSKSWKAKGAINYKLSNPEIRMKWGTPKAQDSRHALTDQGKGNLGEQVSGLHNGGKLNPTWVEWLMGWPIEWTDLKPLEMDKFHSALPQLSESYLPLFESET
jgi:DNA (cytosine-5)-methyltransferase 1